MNLFQSMAAGSWLAQLAIASGALLLAAATALLARRWWRRDPGLGYSLCVALLVGSLALLPVQWTVKGIGHALLAPWRAWWAERSAPVEKQPQPRSPLEDGAMLVDAPMGAADAARQAARREADLRRHGRKSRSPEAYLAASIEEHEAQEAPGTVVPTPLATPIASRRSAGELVAAGVAKVQQWYAAVPKRETLLALWLAGGTWLLVARMRQLGRTMALVRRARRPADPDLVALWRELVAAEPAAARVTLRVSSAVASPACFGWRRPVLLVPADPAPRLSLDALRWALRHELVHVARGDALVATLQAAATTLFWFHPAAWWLSSEVSRLRELSCDRSVVARCGRRRSYAHALLEHAAILNGHLSAIDAEPHSAGVRDALLHWGRSPSQIERRIEMLTVESNGSPRGRRLGGRLLACSLFALPLLAQVGGAATLLPDDGKPAAAPVAPAVPGAPALPVAQSAPAPLPAPALAPATATLPAPATAPRRAISRSGSAAIAPDDPPVAPSRPRARVKRPAGTVPAEAPHALPPSGPMPVTAPLPPPMPRTPALPAAPAAQGGCALCTTPPQDANSSCTAGAACADPAVRDELAKLGYVVEVDDLDDLDALAELEAIEELEEFDEEFADLAIDLEDDFADFEAEFAELADEMAQLEAHSAQQAADVAAQMDEARAEVERALAQAAEEVDRELANADEQLAAAMKAIDEAEGLSDADRAKVKAVLERRMVEARSVAKRALDQSRANADRAEVAQTLAQRRAQGFKEDDRLVREHEKALARMAQQQEEHARAATKQAKVAQERKAATATKRRVADPRADEAAVARKRKVAAQQEEEAYVAKKRAMERSSSDDATPADRQKLIRMQIEKLQQELMRLQDQLAELESASDRDDVAPAPVKRGRSMR